MPILLYALLALLSTGSLGVRVTDIEPYEAAASAITGLHGAVVRELVAGGAAQRAGIRVNDIIVGVGSTTIATGTELVNEMGRHEAGETVTITFYRKGNRLPFPKMTLRVKLGGAANNPVVDNRTRPIPVTPGRNTRPTRSFAAIPVSQQQSGPCSAMLPGGWRVISARDQGDAMDIASGDGQYYVGWGIRGVNRAMQGAYGDFYGDPLTSSRYVVALAGQSMGDGGPFNYTSQPVNIGAGFQAAQLESRGHTAMIVYRVYPPPYGFSGNSYIISLRVAVAPINASQQQLNTAVGVSASINCSVKFVPPKPGDIPLPRPGDAFDRKRSAESGELTDYNVQTGSQYAHSPSTGQSFLLDRASQWMENGPDGPGYYRPVGNSYEKLVPGFQ